MRRRPCRAAGPSLEPCPESSGYTDWLETPALCSALAISRSTLGRWRRRGLLIAGHHWVRKNPACSRSDLLWHQGRCSALLAGARARSPRAMAESLPFQAPEPAGDYVLLHRETGTAGYATRATAAEIHRANQRLQGAGSASRYVAARHLGEHGPQRQG
jgi:hypothetical protein